MSAVFARPGGSPIDFSFVEYARILGAVGLLGSQVKSHAFMPFGQLHPRLNLTVGRGQYRLFAAPNHFPVGFLHWVWLNKEACDGLSAGPDNDTVLEMAIHQAGDVPVCLDVIYLPEQSGLMRQQVSQDLFGAEKQAICLEWQEGRAYPINRGQG